MGREGENCVCAEGEFMIWTRAQSDAIFAWWFLDFQYFQRGLAQCTPGAFCTTLFFQLNPKVLVDLIFSNFWSIIFFHKMLSDFSCSKAMN